ncbi:MAG: hypothetical protein WA919_29815 [Coleofasciculaceae cyanobacterium]
MTVSINFKSVKSGDFSCHKMLMFSLWALVRKRLNLPFEGSSYDWTAFLGDVHLHGHHAEGGTEQHSNDRGLAFIVPFKDGSHRIVTIDNNYQGDRNHALLPSELKHLMARVSAIAKDHAYLAAIEGFMAHHQATNKFRAVERVRHCFAIATGQETYPDLFDEREQAALQLAWISAQMPLTTPCRFVQSAVELYSAEELVHLIVVCSLASMVQRFVAVAQPELESKVAQFLQEYELISDILILRYPTMCGND